MKLKDSKSGMGNEYYTDLFFEEVSKEGKSTCIPLRGDNRKALKKLFGPPIKKIDEFESWEIEYKKDNFRVCSSKKGTEVCMEYLDRKEFAHNKTAGKKIWDFEEWLAKKIEGVKNNEEPTR